MLQLVQSHKLYVLGRYALLLEGLDDSPVFWFLFIKLKDTLGCYWGWLGRAEDQPESC